MLQGRREAVYCQKITATLGETKEADGPHFPLERTPPA
jgi:hypothetical protein